MASAIRVDLSSSVTMGLENVTALAEAFRRALRASTSGAVVTTDSVTITTTPDAVGTVSTTALHKAIAAAPAAPTATAQATQGTPSWGAVPGVIGYIVTVTNSTGGAATGVTGATSRFVPAGTLTLAFTGLTTATQYAFKVAPAFDAALGTYSPLSNVITAG